MADSNLVRSAGTITMRGEGNQREVLVIRRERYHDWSLPKGKLKRLEYAPVAAWRETREETGVTVRIGRPIREERYPIGRKTKSVQWWTGIPLAARPHTPDDEVDEVAWWPIRKALKRLTYPMERRLVADATKAGEGSTLLIVRHAKAVARGSYEGADDAQRPLSRKGVRQSEDLIKLLRAYGVSRIVTSPAVRCTETVKPYADKTGQSLKLVDALAEDFSDDNFQETYDYIAKLRTRAAGRDGRVVAICSHRPVLDTIMQAARVAPRNLSPAELVVAHLDAKGECWGIEDLSPLR